MKHYSEQEIELLIKNNKITYSEGTLYLNDTYITRDEFVSSMKKNIDSAKGNKDKIKLMESNDFSEYNKGSGQKSKNKIRKK